MSRAVELAERLGAIKVRHATFAGELGFALCTDELEAFYRAARAEALREAAALCRDLHGTASLAAQRFDDMIDKEQTK